MNTFVSRRAFLKSATAAGAFAVTLSATPRLLAEGMTEPGTMPGLLRFDASGHATLLVPVPDMGQGMLTTAAQMIADELDMALEHVSVELMPFEGKINDKGQAEMGRLLQGAGGSLSTAEIWTPLRQTAAFMRSLLLDAAARRTGAATAALTTQGGHVVNTASGERLPYSLLVGDVRAPAAPDYDTVTMKAAADRTVVGTDQRNVAAHDIATGKPIYGMDQEVPGMLHAAIRRCPHLRGTLVRHNGSSLSGRPGIQAVIDMPRLPDDPKERRLTAAGVAVVADSYWAARKAADMLEIEWDGSYGEITDTDDLAARAMEALDSAEMTQTVAEGDVEAAMANAAATVEATYRVPNWAHACMEPHSCIADVRADSAEIWCGHQFMDVAINAAAGATGLTADKIKANFFRIGTGFGRKFERDYVTEACFLSKELKKPVKVTWSREDEMEQDYYNHNAYYRMRGGVDAEGRLTAMHVRVAADGSYSSGSKEIPCGLVDNYIGEWTQLNSAISTGAWRGPGSNNRAWATLTFLDELAHAAGVEPLAFLKGLFGSKRSVEMQNWPNLRLEMRRHVALLDKVAQEGGYSNALPTGHGRGFAVFQTHHSLCAHMVEVAMKDNNRDFDVVKVTSAIDCGLAVNPLGIRAQVESGIIDGLCAAKYGKMVFDKGVPVTNNFDTYRKLRMKEAPRQIDVHIMDFGDTEPRGTGETSLPPFIPALTNAIFAACGKRVRTLPISENL